MEDKLKQSDDLIARRLHFIMKKYLAEMDVVEKEADLLYDAIQRMKDKIALAKTYQNILNNTH